MALSPSKVGPDSNGNLAELRCTNGSAVVNTVETTDAVSDSVSDADSVPDALTVNAIEMANPDKTVQELRSELPDFNWQGIPDDLHIGRGINGLPPVKIQSLLDLIREQSKAGVFRTSVNPGTVHPDVAVHRIPTDDARPIGQSPWRSAPIKRQEITKLIQAMLAEDVIRPSIGPWAAPVVLARKKDGKWRFCVDYRELKRLNIATCSFFRHWP